MEPRISIDPNLSFFGKGGRIGGKMREKQPAQAGSAGRYGPLADRRGTRADLGSRAPGDSDLPASRAALF